MNELSRIAKLIAKRGVKNLPLLNVKRDLEQPGLENQLFYNIQDGFYEDDLSASRDIYNSESTDHRYKMLKSRVRQKLLNHLFFLDQEDPNLDRSLILQEDSLKVLNLSNLLVLEKEYEIAEKLLNRCYNLAVEAEFTEILVNSLELLKIIYAENSRPLLLQKNIDEINEKRTLLAIEKEAENIYLKNLVILNKSFNARQKYMQEVAVDLFKLEKIYRETGSQNVFNNFYQLFIKYHLINGEFGNVIDFTDTYERATERKRLNERRYDPVVNKYYLLYALLRNGNYDRILEMAEDLVNKIENLHYWFRINEVYFLTLMHLRRYAKAIHVVHEVSTHKNFSELEESYQLKWSIYIGFLSLEDVKNTFLIGETINEAFNVVPDRKGEHSQLNLAILILQMVSAVKTGNKEKIKDLSGEMAYYIYKHPTAAFSPRSRMFLKLINIMIKYELDAKICRKKGRYLYQQLRNTSQFGDAYDDLEVLPYEVIWERFMALTEKETLSVA